jgi:predicted dehydrogenase
MHNTVIIGAGNISGAHVKALRTLGIGIVGIFDVNTARAQELAGQYGSRVIQSLDEVLEEVDMVHIFTPPSHRVEYVRQATAAGKHIFIEKPIAVSVADANEIIGLAAASRVKLMIGFCQRFRSGYHMLQEAVQDGRLGDVVGVFSYRLGAGVGIGCTPLNANWRNGCGMSIESLSHDIDMLLQFVDGVVSVSANTYGTVPGLPNYDNNSAVTFRLKNGGNGVIHASWSSYLGYSSRGVIGTKGTAMITGDDIFDFMNFSIKTADMPYRQTFNLNDKFISSTQQCYLEINRHFKECIEQDRHPFTSGEDGLRALIFSQAILESDRAGRAVAVDI